jgi:hypothetical protein
MAITVPSMRTMHPAAIHGDRHEPSNRRAPCKEFRSIRRIRKQELASKTGPSIAMDASNITEIKAQAFIEGQLIADCEMPPNRSRDDVSNQDRCARASGTGGNNG